MSSKSINIVLNLSLDGTILSFSVQSSENRKEWTEVLSDSDSPERCPLCSCQISVFTRLATPKLKTEALSEKEDLPDDFQHEIETKVEDLVYSDEDEKPIIEIMPIMDEGLEIKVSVVPNGKKQRHRDKVTPIRCLHCNKVYESLYHIGKHCKRFGIEDVSTEPVPDAVKCTDHCNRYFATQTEMLEHLKGSIKLTYTCKKCSEQFDARQDYLSHLLTHGPLDCRRCSFSFTDRQTYNRHQKMHVRCPKEYRCKVCNRGFPTEDQVAIHTRWLHENNRNCTTCGRTFSNWTRLLEHENDHKNIHPFQCHMCGSSFARKNSFNSHMNSHKDRLYICNFCGMKFKSPRNIREHIYGQHIRSESQKLEPKPKQIRKQQEQRSHLTTDEKKLPCQTCGKMINSNWIKTHMQEAHVSFNERKKFACDVCGKLLLTRSSLKSHLNTHKAVTEFRCKYCGKSLATKCNLKIHEMSHTGERPFTCQTCGKGFRVAMELKTHTRLHTGEKPYECPLEECKKRFSDRGCFRAHLLVHEKKLNIKLIKKKYDYDTLTKK